MVEHRQEFQRDLEAIEAKVIELFAMVAEDLPGATEALLTGNTELVQALAEREQVIDALYPEIEELANREIALQAPVASDLRFLLSVLRIVPELERSHDLVIDISHRANHILSQDLSPRTRGLVEQMGKLVSGMWRQAADSWYQRDSTAAVAAPRAGRRDGRAARQPDRRARLRADGPAGDDGDDARGPLVRASGRARGQHRAPGDLPGRHPAAGVAAVPPECAGR